MVGWYRHPVQYGRESAHKNWSLGNHSSLGDYIYEIHHINEEENVLINRPPTFPIFPWTLVFHQVQGF
jgi:hypothetical protein